MKPEQRREVISKFNKATLKSKISTIVIGGMSSRIAVSPESSGITKLTITTLQCMWEKAEVLMNSDNMITPAPGDDASAKMILSYVTGSGKTLRPVQKSIIRYEHV